jgi:hypothetical protein
MNNSVDSGLENTESKPQVRAGFTVAVLDNGEFAFKVLGTDPGVIELHGLLEFSRKMLHTHLKEMMGTDEVLVLNKLEELQKQVENLRDTVSSLAAPKVTTGGPL